MPARETSGGSGTSTPRILIRSGTGFHNVCHERCSSLEERRQLVSAIQNRGVVLSNSTRGAGANSPNDSTKCQDHLEMMDQKNMDAEIKQCFDRGRREVFEQATSIDEDGEAAEESVEQGLLVAGARAINPPEAKYAEDESSQDGQLP